SPGLARASLVLMLLASLLALGSRLAIAQQGVDIYASADLRPAGAAEGPPPPGTPSGSVTFEHLAGGKTRVTVTAMGLTPNSMHATRHRHHATRPATRYYAARKHANRSRRAPRRAAHWPGRPIRCALARNRGYRRCGTAHCGGYLSPFPKSNPEELNHKELSN